MVLVALLLYAAALVFREALGEHGAHGQEEAVVPEFANVGTAFFTLFRCVVASDCSTREGQPIFVIVGEDWGAEYAVMYCFLVFIMDFGLFNVIVALYVESTIAA